MLIHVTQDHINRGQRGSCSSDPVALALLDAGFIRPWVSPTGIRTDGFNGGFMREDWTMPEEVVEFIKNFDNFGFVDPFDFPLEGRWK